MDIAEQPCNVLSLCTGAGGLDDGFRLAVPNSRIVCCVEWEAFAAAELVRRMETGELAASPVWTDLRTFDGRAWRGIVQAVIGGFPCQPHSMAGKRKGEKDDRNLWPDVARIVGEVQPEIVFFENVPGLCTSGDGMFFRKVIEDLEQLGYEVATTLLSAESVGASHKRMRLFILGVADSNRIECTGERIHLRKRRSGQEDTDSGGPSRVNVVNASGKRRRKGRPEPELRSGRDSVGQFDGGVEHPTVELVGDTECSRREEAGSGRQQYTGREPEPGSGELGDTNSRGCRTVGEQESGDEDFTSAGHGLGVAGVGMADPGNAGLPVAECPVVSGSQRDDEGRATAELCPAPLVFPTRFPPRPGCWFWITCADGRAVRLPLDADAAAWVEILGLQPKLAPALSQSDLRGVADGLATNRARYLKLEGNGVVPTQAATAFCVLWAAIREHIAA